MNNYNYKIIIKLLVYQILVITVLIFTSYVDFNYISQRFYTSFESDKLEYFKTIKINHIIHEEIVVNTVLYNFFFAMTSIAFTFLFGIKDITLDYMFPSSTTAKWVYNVIFYWYTGIISLLFIYFKQLKQMRKDYESEKNIHDKQ